MKTKILLFLFCFLSLNVMGQGTVTRQKKQTTTQTSVSKPKTTTNSKPKPQPNAKPKPVQQEPAEAAGYDVTFTCNVSSASLYIDGTSYGTVAGTRFLRTGSHSIKLTCGGYDDYSTDITVNRSNTSFTFNMTKQPIPEKITVPTGDFNLKECLNAPMGISSISFDKNPTYNEMMRILGKVYKMYDSDNSTYLYVGIFSTSNKNLEFPSYQGIPFSNFSVLFNLDEISNPMVEYQFTTPSRNKPSLTEMYKKLDHIVQDFHAIGIPIEYEKKNETYTKAKGEVKVNNVKYVLELNEYTNFSVTIRFWY